MGAEMHEHLGHEKHSVEGKNEKKWSQWALIENHQG